MEETVICVWNRDWYADLVQAQGLTLVFNVTALHQTLAKQPPQAVVLLAELNWSGREMDFYGMDLLCQLRADRGLSCPIGVASFLSFDGLRQRFPILDFSSQHPFIRLPATPLQMAAMVRNGKVADPFRLQDIIRNYCNPQGRLVKLLTHGAGLRNLVRCQGTLSAKELLALQDDYRLLQHYLQHSFLEKNIDVKAREVANQIERMLIEASADNIAVAQNMVQGLIRAL